MEEDKRAYLYRYIGCSSAWGFVPIADSDMGTEKVSLKPIETWTTSKGEIVTLCDCTYSIVAIREMMNLHLTELNDKRGIIYPRVKNPSRVVVCIAEEETKTGKMNVCMVNKHIDSDMPDMQLISHNHSHGCEPRYGQAGVFGSIDALKMKMQETAILNVTSTKVHEKDWRLYV